MSPVTRFEPARWLVCSSGIYHSLRDFWQPQFRERSLFSTRIKHGWIEEVPPAGLATRMQSLAKEGVSSLFVLVDGMDDDAADALLNLPADIAALDPVVVDWPESKMAALMQLNAPDPQLRSLLDDASREPVPLSAGDAEVPGWWADLEQALVDWETQARDLEPDDFGQFLPHHAKVPINWRHLAGVDAVLVGVPTVFLVTGPRDAANEFSYEEHPLEKQMFGNSPDDSTVVQERSAYDHKAERLSVLRSPITGKQAVYLSFQAETDEDGKSSYSGSHVLLIIEGVTYDLGLVQEDGMAECRIEGTVNILGVDAVLRIGKKKKADLG